MGGLDPRIFAEDRFVDSMLCRAGTQPIKWGVIELSLSTLTELAGKLNRDVTTLSSGARRMRTRAIQHDDLAMKMQEFKKILAQVAMSQS